MLEIGASYIMGNTLEYVFFGQKSVLRKGSQTEEIIANNIFEVAELSDGS